KSDTGAINLSIGNGDTDNDAAFHLAGTLSAATISVTSTQTIYLDDLNLPTSGVTTLSITSTGGGIFDSNPDDGGDDVDVTADSLHLPPSTGIGTSANPIQTQVSTIGADTSTGGIFIHNGVTTPTPLAVAGTDGVRVTGGGAGDITLTNEGSITVTTAGD